MTETIIIAVLTSSALGVVVARVFDLLERRSGINEDFQLLLLNAIKAQCRAAIADGYITMDDLESLEKTFARYKKRKGNGYADTLMAQVRRLPIRREE